MYFCTNGGGAGGGGDTMALSSLCRCHRFKHTMTSICNNICMKQILAWFVCPARYHLRNIMFQGCPCVHPSVRHTLWVPLCVQHPAKAMIFQQIIMHVLKGIHDVDVHLLFCVDLDLHLTCSQGHV